jgi:hypothetical protein
MSGKNNTRVTQYLLIGLAVVVLLILVSQYYSKKSTPTYSEEPFVPEDEQRLVNIAKPEEVQPSDLRNSDQFRPVNYKDSKAVEKCAPKDKLTVEDLLPKDAANSKWAQVAPAGQGDVGNQNFLTAGYLMGVNTVGPTLRNSNQQLRSDPPIERMNVSPWNQTTIEYDASRKFFEIGEC